MWHRPTARLAGAIELPDGAWVRGRGLRRPPPAGPPPDYGLYLGSTRLRRQHDDTLAWAHDWVAWPDFLLPPATPTWRSTASGLCTSGPPRARVEVACGGGVGRTGTVIACLAVLAGLPPDDAVAWTRAHHHRRAVETPWQRRWVARFPTP